MSSRVPGLAGLAWGAALLGRGDGIWRGLTARAPSAVEHRVVTVLGLRHLGQGLLQTALPSRLSRLSRLWLLTDLAHLASMLALAVADRGRRRPALVSAAVSLTGVLSLAPDVRGRRRLAAVPRPLVPPRRAHRPHG
ncbi:hypothetical protein GCM10009616_24500 [Microlunatus lacustris]